MSFLRGLLWFVFAVAMIAVAMYVTGNYELADRLTGLFLTIQPWLPISFDFDQFLVALTVLSLIFGALIVTGCTLLVVFLSARLSIAHQKQAGQATAAKREIGHVKGQHERQYGQLLSLGQTLTKQLDNRVIAQSVVEETSRLTSVAHANSAVSLWLLNFETDTLRFERGIYCDETFFIKNEFQPTELPFARVISTQKPWVLPVKDLTAPFVKADKAAQLALAGGLMVVPLLIENSVLGVLVIFCHEDVLKGYEGQKPFYDALWGELSLGVAIAIRGALAILDRLTGAHNREYFMQRLTQELDRANRFQVPCSLLMIDIDNFKAVNDTLGHPQGDAVLKIISRLIRKEVRVIDLVGRYGGEEFIVMLPETGYGEEVATSTSGALLVAERIRKAVEEEFHGLQKPLNLTISIGVCIRRFPEDREQDIREIIRLADEQLYRAKTTGKNKVCVVLPENTPQASG